MFDRLARSVERCLLGLAAEDLWIAGRRIWLTFWKPQRAILRLVHATLGVRTLSQSRRAD
jgi:hypothetical protein